MLSRFFIDRPIFATVLSVVITLVGGIALVFLPIAQYPRITPPGISVSISYPGASARTVADTVAAPIEQQVNGIDGMLYMSSQSGNDGSYTLSITFDVGVDLNTALVMVQNRVALAMPLLPTPVQNQGITIRKKTPDILMIINFYDDSPNGRYDDIYLSNFALINVKDELLRVDGVSDVSIFGERDYSVRVWLDPQKIAARQMTAGDVAKAIRSQNLEAALGQVGQPPTSPGQSLQRPVDALGRLVTPEQFGAIVLKVGGLVHPKAPAASTATRPGTSLPSPVVDPLQGAIAQQPMSTSGTTSSTSVTSSTSGTSSGTSSTTSSTPALGVNTSGGGSTGGGSTSSGGATTGGGGTTGGAATVGGTTPPTDVTPSPALLAPAAISATATSPAIASSLFGNAVVSGSTIGRGPQPPTASIVRLRDVARVEMGALNYNQSATFDGKPAVGCGVFQLPGTNALDVANRVRAKMRELKQRFPEGVVYKIGYDTTPFIRESISEVFHTLRDAVILVAIVVLVFLQDWRAMILPMIDVPVSLIGTFAVMAVMGYSLNNISLFGLVLAIGIVVDDAIVVLENIERQMARGYDARTATIKAMQEITGPILAITLVLCAVFVPCAFISGITGRFFRQFAVTIAASTVISAINALTMTPSRALVIFRTETGAGHERKREALPWWIFGLLGLLTVWLGETFLSGHLGVPSLAGIQDDIEAADLPDWWAWTVTNLQLAPDTAFSILSWALSVVYFIPGMLLGLVLGWFIIRPVNFVLHILFTGFNRTFDAATTAYGWTIGSGLRLSVIVLLIYGGLLILTVRTFQTAPTGFVPQQDMGRLIISVQLPDSASLQRTQEIMKEVEQITRDTKGVAHTIGIAGISFIQQSNGPNFGSLFVILDPFARRQSPRLKDEAIMARLRKQWAEKIRDAQVFVSGASPIPGLSVAGGFKLIVEDRGGLGLLSLQNQTDKLISTIEKRGPNLGLTSVSTSFRSRIPQLFLDIDRTKAASLGVALDDINQTLQIYLGSLYVNSFNEFGRHWQVTLQSEGWFRSEIDDVNLLQVRNKSGQMVLLGTLVTMKPINGPIFVQRYNLYTAAPITGSLLPGVSSGNVIAAVGQLADEKLPRSMKADWTELMFMQIREGNTTLIVFGLAVICVFLALAALYESWTLPLAVILVVPLCVLSSVIGVRSTNTTVNIFVQIGLVVLVGLACKNAILVVEFAKQLRQEGMSRFEATLTASRLRLRPILMTSLAFILGVVPLVFANGAGAEMRRSLGTAVFSGMIGVTTFGIFLTPVFFYVIQKVDEAPMFKARATRWAIASVLGGLVGLAAGFLLAQIGLVDLVWGLIAGGGGGALLTLLFVGAHEMFRRRQTPLAG
jgi:multidrug efflux pump